MRISSRLLCRLGVALVAGLAFAASGALAANYPDKPLQLMVSYPPGGATDFQARIVTMMASKYLKEPVVIINKAGAGGQVGWNWFASSATQDGYDLGAYNLPHFIAQSIVFDTKYNINNVEPIANWGADPAVLIVPKSSPFNSVKDFVAYAKKNPGKITVSGAGLFVGHHIATLQLEKAAGIKLTYVPAKGGVAALQMVMGKQVMAGFNNLSDAYRSQDRVKILAVADNERNKEFLPNVPTFKESGIAVDDSSVNFRGIMVRKGTPQPIIDMLAKEVPKMFHDKKVIKKMKAGGSPMHVMTRAQVQKMFKSRHEYLVGLLKKLRKKK
ncbi:MAG: tripartite tricarboxylate transporter substrate binding protein [Pseudolabrys sp.]|jgi:tripartite-type tricarboxylate transporter receptor subunit TctC